MKKEQDENAMEDKVEILLAAYNGEQYIREQLDSLLSQTYENWIVRAGDDGSSDRTFEILKEYKSRYPEKFVIEKREKGSGSAMNHFFSLIRESKEQYVMCCDQDDVWFPDKISVTLRAMKEQEAMWSAHTPILIHTDLKVADTGLQVESESFFTHSNFRKQFSYRDILIQNHVTGCTMMMNRPLAELMKRPVNLRNIWMHDWLAAALASSVGKVYFVDRPTMLYRQHQVNSVGAKKYGFALFISKVKERQMRQSLQNTAVQAGEIAKVYGADMEKKVRELTGAYGQIWNHGKCYRIWFYICHRVWKKGLPRKICQLIVG